MTEVGDGVKGKSDGDGDIKTDVWPFLVLIDKLEY